MFYYFLSTYINNLLSIISRFFNNIVLIFSIWVISYSKVFQYLRYKKVFLDENQKQGFQTWKKTLKSHKNKIKNPSKKMSWVIEYNNYVSYLFHENVVIHQCKLMFLKIIGSGLTLWWSDTPQYITNGNTQSWLS